eukprot:gene8267-5960_t
MFEEKDRTVNAVYDGIWRRKAIYRKNGTVDTTTKVWWFQAPSICIDLRVHETGAVDKNSGFAGKTLQYSEDGRAGDRLEWRPEIAFPFLNLDEVDSGMMNFVERRDGDSGATRLCLHEVGMCGTYEEDWYKEEGEMITSHSYFAEALDDGSTQVHFCIETPHWKAEARGRAADSFVGNETDATKWCAISVYHRDTADDQWNLTASTLPPHQQR